MALTALGIAAITILGSASIMTAYAVQTQTSSAVSGSGTAQTFSCPGGVILTTSPTGFQYFQIVFSATGPNNKMTGTWEVDGFTPDPAGPSGVNASAVKAGAITSGGVSANHFILYGYESSDSLCGTTSPTATTFANIKISGVCSPNSKKETKIEFSADNGEAGNFIGIVKCHGVR
jgi:hypothetical protein